MLVQVIVNDFDLYLQNVTWVLGFGTPIVLKSDNGRPFNGTEFAAFAKKLGFHHRKITPLWPEANGEAEKFVRTVNKFIHACESENSSWKEELLNFLHQFRSIPHSSTGVSPHEALTGRKMKTSLPQIHTEMDSSSSTSSKLAMKDFASKAKQKEFADRTRTTQPHSLTVGDTVLLRQKKTNKLTPPYIPKPYKVADVKGSMITAKRGTHQIVRNSWYFKQIPYQQVEEKEEINTDTDVLEDFPETHQQQYPQPHAEQRSPLPTRSPRATQARPRLASSYSPHSSRQAQSPHSPGPTGPTLVEQSNSPKRVMQPPRSYPPTQSQTCPYIQQ
ncbi:transposon Ty3-G Gag-Pol polyprotein [Elysia marginata]|uniref:Transposon Ty3-G Gag-Pol polyprotein n=1 Tax=Elysia marginata TaxID=1093978 RepID=A0AAV4EPJ7_9GAST|nr:transposon Ty3-G Gag-Pol polyprotein [Elysia marginata]